MTRRVGYLWLVLAVVSALVGGFVEATTLFESVTVQNVSVQPFAVRGLFSLSLILVFYGVYWLVLGILSRRGTSKRRLHDVRNVLRLVLGALSVVAVLGVITNQWVGVLLSLGVVGFAITFALQQPLLSLIAWVYIMVKRPYTVGDRVKISDTKGDVIEVDFLVTTLWEINGDLVSSHQPSGRVVTVPNSVVLSSEVVNYGGAGITNVWNELVVQVALETDLAFARETMVEIADDYLGDEMAANIASYREMLEETPVELEVQDRPSVNVVQTESWVELKLRYLTHPRRGTTVRNELYARILDRFNDEPERVKFPVGRSR